MAGYSNARLTAAVSAAPSTRLQPAAASAGSLLQLALEGSGRRSSGRELGCLLYVPATYRPGVPAPLILTLHGASGDAHGETEPLLLAHEDA